VTLTWKRVECIGEVNAARAGHVACVYENYMIMFGGGDGVNWLSDIYELDMRKYQRLENSHKKMRINGLK
jgi:hypothetical protein